MTLPPLPPFDPLEDALAHPTHVDDAGFSARVLDALPRPGRARAFVLAAGGLASAGAAGLVLAGPLLPLVTALASGRVSSLAVLAAALEAVIAPIATAFVALGAEQR